MPAGRLIAPLLTLALLAGLEGCAPAGTSAPRLAIEAEPAELPADGHSTAEIRVRPAAPGLTLRLEEHRKAAIEGRRALPDGAAATFRAGIVPGRVTVIAEARGYAPTEISLTLRLDPSDRYGDGLPDVLRLEAADRDAFRAWFTFLAEVVYHMPPEQVPREIDDCGALLRFAYRETLADHNAAWAARLALPFIPPVPPVAKYAYPYTPLGASLFRIRGEAFQPGDLAGGAFAQFADAETLRRHNTHFVSRDLGLARPGDLLFYRQIEQDLPFHAMVFLGPGHLGGGAEPRIVYHTGPIDGGPGELRLRTVAELMNHPSPRWRPLAGNSNFLGVYRWNILREEE